MCGRKLEHHSHTDLAITATSLQATSHGLFWPIRHVVFSNLAGVKWMLFGWYAVLFSWLSPTRGLLVRGPMKCTLG